MLHDPTLDKLHALRLAPMANAWLVQQKNTKSQNLSFDERFAMLVDAEYLARDNRRLARLLKDASLRIAGACIEDVEANPARGIDKPMRSQLALSTWIREHLNVLITGPTGVGKSYLACALAQSACRMGIRALYKRVPRLLEELALAKADGTYSRLLTRLARVEVLVLDDWGLQALESRQRHDLLEVIEDRYGQLSTVVTSQLPVANWHEWIADPTLADALLDRLVHNAYKIELKGNSKRKQNKPTEV